MLPLAQMSRRTSTDEQTYFRSSACAGGVGAPSDLICVSQTPIAGKPPSVQNGGSAGVIPDLLRAQRKTEDPVVEVEIPSGRYDHRARGHRGSLHEVRPGAAQGREAATSRRHASCMRHYVGDLRSLRPSGHIMPDHAGDRGAALWVLAPHDHLHIKHERALGPGQMRMTINC